MSNEQKDRMYYFRAGVSLGLAIGAIICILFEEFIMPIIFKTQQP
jgi:hypothetical protein